MLTAEPTNSGGCMNESSLPCLCCLIATEHTLAHTCKIWQPVFSWTITTAEPFQYGVEDTIVFLLHRAGRGRQHCESHVFLFCFVCFLFLTFPVHLTPNELLSKNGYSSGNRPITLPVHTPHLKLQILLTVLPPPEVETKELVLDFLKQRTHLDPVSIKGTGHCGRVQASRRSHWQ